MRVNARRAPSRTPRGALATRAVASLAAPSGFARARACPMVRRSATPCADDAVVRRGPARRRRTNAHGRAMGAPRRAVAMSGSRAGDSARRGPCPCVRVPGESMRQFEAIFDCNSS
ncbi:hypothetical protein AQ477_24500 [Burkholderia thailandensis]|nr:hypothetical protein AQ477_24500 [Burkholderia thailandensis]KXF58803.1 hypothetical protein AQ476_29635 [Burkholderia thailandensis]PNE78606.1 hypothetical protein A8H37_10800 [Burkholderia thailandensis]